MLWQIWWCQLNTNQYISQYILDNSYTSDLSLQFKPEHNSDSYSLALYRLWRLSVFSRLSDSEAWFYWWYSMLSISRFVNVHLLMYVFVNVFSKKVSWCEGISSNFTGIWSSIVCPYRIYILMSILFFEKITWSNQLVVQIRFLLTYEILLISFQLFFEIINF